MTNRYILSVLIACSFTALQAQNQTNIRCTNPTAEQVLKGTYNPADYFPASTTPGKTIISQINTQINSDSLKSYLVQLNTYGNRNSGSDTVTAGKGIGGARKWAYEFFQKVSTANAGRLIVSYLQFNQEICVIKDHKNIMAVLPGTDVSNHEVILIEGHIDSRCEDVCDIGCVAPGMEDNGSGTALVMELARVMSQYSYKNTIVFMLTIAEEQGLYGAEAFANYCTTKKIPLKAVLNNDVIGGILCGKTSSPPSCPGLNAVDSTQVRLFSSGKNLSPHKSLARYVKLQYQEELLPIVSVPMTVSIMNAEDRTGRGGDHIPFRQLGFNAIRFTSANEHGDANPVAGYTDRQHSVRDVLGVDKNMDSAVDSFFVDFHYLARNAVINGVAAAQAAIGVVSPTIDVKSDNGLSVTINSATNYPLYRIGIRTLTNDFDTIINTTDTLNNLKGFLNGTTYFISVSAVNDEGVESLFSPEKQVKLNTTGIKSLSEQTGVELLSAYPNPFDETTTIAIQVNKPLSNANNYLLITDLHGKEIRRMPLQLQSGMNEVVYEHGYHAVGVYQYTLFLDGKKVDTKRMVFSN